MQGFERYRCIWRQHNINTAPGLIIDDADSHFKLRFRHRWVSSVLTTTLRIRHIRPVQGGFPLNGESRPAD